jgi:geranyl-CoA carboxylase alpha subunit
MARFDTLLVANRGEIACRVIRSARAAGLRTVAVYSDPDAGAPHVRDADVAVRIGPGPARDSYLDAARILEACRATGAQAVHPGYGFLSESADFARACRDAGLVFVGPPPESIDALGNKSAAKRVARRVDVPCLPGYEGGAQDDDKLVTQARRIGAPLMIKAAAGGGGRGMRRSDDVGDEPALRALLGSARDEALASFGSGELLLERRLDEARHVEVQVFGDEHGGCVHLGERDCSTQRRNQKILEESPAPGVSDALRARMGEAAVRLAREVGYVGAGTVEFLLAPDGAFWFLEMNTRLQVEHPVTEAVTGLDLVDWQLRVAQGEPMPLAQHEIRWTGHAIEARLCAEDAYGGFVPQVGTVRGWRLPQGPGLRVDHGLAEPAEVTPHYDSMIAKLIAHGADREAARARLVSALGRTAMPGLRTNRDFLLDCLRSPVFAEGRLSTAWLGEASGAWTAPAPDARWLAIAAALRVHDAGRRHGPFACWSSAGRRTTPMRIAAAGREVAVRVEYGDGGAMRVGVAAATRPGRGAATPATVATGATGATEVAVASRTPTDAPQAPSPDAPPPDAGVGIEVLGGRDGDVDLVVDGLRTTVRARLDAGGGWLDAHGISEAFADLTDVRRDAGDDTSGGSVTSRMHGLLVKLAVAPGQRVARGEFLLAIEAMKMEHRFEAPIAGTVAEVGAVQGAQVSPGRLLVRIEADPAAPAEPR